MFVCSLRSCSAGECFGEIVLLGSHCRQARPHEVASCVYRRCDRRGRAASQVYTVRTKSSCELYSLSAGNLAELKGFFPDDFFSVYQKALLRLFRIMVRSYRACGIGHCVPLLAWSMRCRYDALVESLSRAFQDFNGDGTIDKIELGTFAKR